MPKLYFRVASDWDQVVKLREEITKLESQLKSMDANKAPHAVATLNRQINEAQSQLKGMVSEAAKAAVVMGDDLKSKIYKSSQAVNDFTQKIIDQKAVVKDVEADVRKLTTAYNNVRRNPLQASSALAELNGAKKALNEEKAALFGLTQQQANARLSVRKLKDEYALYNTQVIDTTSSTFSLGRALGVIGGIAVLKQLGSEIINVRGQFRSMEISLETMVGKDKAKSLLSEIKQYAAISPLELKDVQSATEMMVGFNVEAEKVPRFIQAIGDISRGESQKFQSLSLAFSQTSAAGKLMGQDLNQMINAGFNPLQIISEKTGKSMAQLKDEMSKGAISAETVQQAFIDATSAGGKFYGMSEKQSQEVSGQMSILSDTINNKLNEIGESNEGIIKSGIGATTYLVNNYETIGRVISGLVATYGTYRAALVLNAVLEEGFSKAVWSKVTATKAAALAQTAYNKVLAMNPYVAVGAALVTLGIAMWTLADHTSAAEKAQKRFNETSSASKRQLDELRGSVEGLISTIKSETSTQYDKTKAYKELQKLMPTVFSNMDIEKLKLMDILSLNKQISEELNRRERIGVKTSAVLRQNELNSVNSKLNVAIQEQAESPSGQKASVIDKLQKQKLEAEESVKLANKAVEDIEKLQTEANKPKKTKTETKNKSYWEKRKQEAEASRDALGVEKKGSEEWEKYSKQIQTAQKNIDIYSDSKTAKQENQADKLRKQTDKYNVLLSKQATEEKRASEDLQTSVDEARIKAMDEGSEKTIAQMELNFEKEMQTIDRQKEDALRKKVDDARSVFEANPKNKGKSFDASGITLSDSETNGFDEKYKSVIAGFIKEQEDFYQKSKNSWNEYLKDFGSYLEKRKAIQELYQDKIKKADTDGEKATLGKQMQNELDDLDNSIQNSATLMGQLFADSSKKSVNEIQTIIDKAELLMKYLESPKDEQGNATIGGKSVSKKDIINLGVSENSLNNLESSVDEVESLRNAISKLKGELGSKSPFKLFESDIKSAIKTIGQGGKKNIAQGITDIGNAVNSFSPSISQFGQSLGNIFGNDDLGNKIAGVGDVIGGLGQTAAGVGQIMSGDIVGGAMAAVNGISKVVTALDGLFGANYDEYNEMKAKYDILNDIWDELIDKKREYIDISYGAEADKVGMEAAAIVQNSIDSYRTLGLELLNSGASMGSSSIGRRIRKNMSREGWDQWDSFANSIGMNPDDVGGRMEGLFSLTADQLEKLKSDAPVFWSKLNDETRDYLNKIIEGSEKIEDIQKQVQEQLTQTTFDGVYDNFIDTLMDMKADASDFSEDLSEMFMRSLLSNEIGNKYYDKLKGWYEKWSEAMKIEDETKRKLELDSLRQEYEGYVDSAIKERNDLANTIGYTGDSVSSDQSSTSKGYQTMSQDEGEELNGRFTALQIAGEEIKLQSVEQTMSLKDLSGKADEILTVNSDIRNIADDTRNILASTYLETVAIRENTEAIVKPIKSMAADIAEVKKNTAGLAT